MTASREADESFTRDWSRKGQRVRSLKSAEHSFVSGGDHSRVVSFWYGAWRAE